MSRAILLVLALLFFALPAEAACTRGLNCYCNCVQNTDSGTADVGAFANSACQTLGVPKETNVVYCEDGENPKYLTSTADGAGAWSDIEPGFAGTRGAGSGWRDTYNAAQAGCGWAFNTPTPATRGVPFSSWAYGATAGDWSPSDTWQANSFACIDVHQSGDSLPLLKPSDPPFGNVNVPSMIKGNAIIGEVRLPGTIDSAGGHTWTAKSNIAFSQILQFSSNYWAQKVYQVKFPEWWDRDGNATSLYFLAGTGTPSDFPFGNLSIDTDTSVSTNECRNIVMLNATIHVGFERFTHTKDPKLACLYDGVSMDNATRFISMVPEGYDRATDWPVLTVPHVARGVLEDYGSTSVTWKVWFDDRLILHVSGIDFSMFSASRKLIGGLMWDNYWNQNDLGSVPNSPTTQTTVRWFENTLVRGWTDAECTAAGADCAAQPTLAEMEFVAATTPVISLSPTTLTPSGVAGGANPTNGSFTVSNTGTGGSGGLTWDSVTDDAAWLSISAGGTGTTPGSVTIAYNTTGLAAGTYNATITVTDAASTPTTATVSVVLTVTAAPTPTIALVPTTLSPSGIANGVDPVDMTFTVDNVGGGTLNYFVGVTQPWLSVTPASGSSTGEADAITVSFDITGLAAGIHTDTIQVADGLATNTPQSVAVTLTLAAAPIPIITLTPTALAVAKTVQGGANPSSQIFTVDNTGSGTLSYSISEGTPWLSVTPTAGTSTGEADTITVSFNATGLVAGTYSGTITVADGKAGNNPQTIEATIVITGLGTPSHMRIIQ